MVCNCTNWHDQQANACTQSQQLWNCFLDLITLKTLNVTNYISFECGNDNWILKFLILINNNEQNSI